MQLKTKKKKKKCFFYFEFFFNLGNFLCSELLTDKCTPFCNIMLQYLFTLSSSFKIKRIACSRMSNWTNNYLTFDGHIASNSSCLFNLFSKIVPQPSWSKNYYYLCYRGSMLFLSNYKVLMNFSHATVCWIADYFFWLPVQKISSKYNWCKNNVTWSSCSCWITPQSSIWIPCIFCDWGQ